MYFDADHFYGRILEVEKSANKSFPDYKRGIAKVRKMMANEPNVDAVEVVRCGNCEWHNDPIMCICQDKTMGDYDYCSQGKRKDKHT